ncbi:hypothetical protein [Halorhabdus sp. BNX81]|uniref:hypothetical protein n=1 Tax=Halorhabdus sp. BNX81 TaxID=2980181 RepID=UPI0023DD574E|nr:hypothetical protein [Halorhabdus sp. BNX81]WEL20520.1 putative membrane protein [Halorhabdus sp. BNX81]
MVDIAEVALGLGLTLAGVASIVGARSIADLSEQLDAIGSTHSAAETEAAPWKVSMYRYSGAFIAFLGLLFVLAGLGL